MPPSTSNRRKPRVLIVAEWFYPTEGGSQRVTHNLAEALSHRGWQVTVYTRAMPGSEEFDRSVPYKVRRSRTWARLWNLNLHGGGVSRAGRALASLYLLLAFFRWRWDVLIAMHLVPVAFPGKILRLLGRPVVVWAHGEEIEVGLRSTLMRIQVRASLRMASFTVCNSHDTAGLVERAAGAGLPIAIQFPTPGRPFFEPLSTDRKALRAAWCAPDEVLLVTVSRLAERKGIDSVLRALANLRARAELRPWRYLIGGVGDDKPRLRSLVDKLGLQDRVQFVGSLREAEKRDLVEAADLFVMPNRELANGEKEGFGIVFVEAALRGTPSLGGRSGGTTDALTEGKSGWLVDSRTHAETERLLGEILADPARAAAMRPTCREWAMKTFRSHLRHDEVASRLKELIRRKAARTTHP